MTFDRFLRLAATRRGAVAAIVCAVAAAGLVPRPAAAETAGPTVFAAASLKTALDEIDAAWTAKTGRRVTVSYAASSALAAQLEQGAPAAVFISADIPWMDHAAGKDLIRPESRFDLVGNALVLVAPAPARETIDLVPGVALAAAIGDGKLATGTVASVPAGRYAKATLEALGIWKDVEAKIAGTDNVRAALGLVARGEAKYGIVYATDAVAEPGVAVVGTFPAGSHPPIVYPVAITKESTNPDAAAYVAFLRGPEATKIFVGQGFTIPKR